MQEIKTRKWKEPPEITVEISNNLIKYPQEIRQALFTRGIHDIEKATEFFDATKPLFDPYLLFDMDKAVNRFLEALHQNEKIAIYGDFDADGICATALLTEALSSLGAKLIPYIPDRLEEGYGLNIEAIKYLASIDAKLIITVDCGIRSIEEVALAQSLGMDVIVSDHHYPRETIPPAYAILCPKREGEPYPNKDISGVGLAYKLASAILLQEGFSVSTIERYLDLVALGTVADVVPLNGENRVLVRKGIEVIHRGERMGLFALTLIAGLDIKNINAHHIGFMIGPRLNAAGRISEAEISLHLLLEKDKQKAIELAKELDRLNSLRQEKTKAAINSAEEIIAIQGQKDILSIVKEDYEEGIVGLVAAKLKEKFYRPTIVGVIRENTIRASCRSIPEFHITQALDSCANLLLQHGGHALAAGFTINHDKYDLLIEKLNEIAMEKLEGKEIAPELKGDAIVSLGQFQPESSIEYLNLFEPTGSCNQRPLFFSKNVSIKNKWKIGRDESHLKLSVIQDGITYDAIAFGKGEMFDSLAKSVDIAYHYDVNHFNGEERLQLHILDIKNVGDQNEFTE